eukprot:UN22147
MCMSNDDNNKSCDGRTPIEGSKSWNEERCNNTYGNWLTKSDISYCVCEKGYQYSGPSPNIKETDKCTKCPSDKRASKKRRIFGDKCK